MSDVVSSKGPAKERNTWSWSREDNGNRISVEAQEAENGWVIDIYRSWYETSPDGQKIYQSSSEKYISKRDPRVIAREKKENLDTAKNPELKPEFDSGAVMDSLAGQQGMLIV